jgi:chaperonin GroES
VNTVNVRPLNDRILVKRMEEDTTTPGGIIIPDSAKEKPSRGQVVAAGQGKTSDDGKKIPLEVKVGDTILFGKWSGTEIKLDGEDYLMMKEEDVLGVIN